MLITGLTIMYMTKQGKAWLECTFTPTCLWDAWFHVILPGCLISTLGYFQLADQFKREVEQERRYRDLQ
jgi:hypothetical protein